jgi:hypothetical protein
MIIPGYQQLVDHYYLHQPRSTLLLVLLIGEDWKRAYQYALETISASLRRQFIAHSCAISVFR